MYLADLNISVYRHYYNCDSLPTRHDFRVVYKSDAIFEFCSSPTWFLSFVQIRRDFRGLYKSDVNSTYLLPTCIGDIADFGYTVYAILFGLPIFWLWAYLMKNFPETRRAH